MSNPISGSSRRHCTIAALAVLAGGLLPANPDPSNGDLDPEPDDDASAPPINCNATLFPPADTLMAVDGRHVRTYRDEAAAFNARQRAKSCPRQILLKQDDTERILAQVAKAVDLTADPGETLELVSQMTTLLAAAEGLGLAANQVGVLERVVVFAHEGLPIAMVNPVITDRRGRGNIMTEGCLSLPNQAFLVQRADVVDVEWVGYDAASEAWVERRGTFEGLAARIVQHEVDHLHGILVTSRALTKGRHGRVLG